MIIETIILIIITKIEAPEKKLAINEAINANIAKIIANLTLIGNALRKFILTILNFYSAAYHFDYNGT